LESGHHISKACYGVSEQVTTALGSVIENIAANFIENTDVGVKAVAIPVAERFGHKTRNVTVFAGYFMFLIVIFPVHC